MAEVLGLGMTHYPPLGGKDENMANALRGRLRDAGVPAEAKLPANWPPRMREEWGDDEGVAAASRHRAEVLRGVRRVREALDDFNPDVVIVFGDDQYENFRESIIPPFCLLAYDDMDVFPWRDASASSRFSAKPDQWGGGKPNVWNEGIDFSMHVKGHREFGKLLASRLLESDFDVAYAYEPLNHPGLSHAFLNAVLYLDYDRKGFPWPLLPFQINCYGRNVISCRGYTRKLSDVDLPFDPPSPSPRRVFDLGAAVARVCRDSPLRTAIVASSSWSHAFLNNATHRMRPDIDFDRRMFTALKSNDLQAFRQITLADLEASGNQEMLAWCGLAGAMAELGHCCAWSEMVETYLFNSSKVAAIFAPPAVNQVPSQETTVR